MLAVVDPTTITLIMMALALVLLFGVLGYGMNIIRLIVMFGDERVNIVKAALRLIGVFVPVIGVIMGYIK